MAGSQRKGSGGPWSGLRENGRVKILNPEPFDRRKTVVPALDIGLSVLPCCQTTAWRRGTSPCSSLPPGGPNGERSFWANGREAVSSSPNEASPPLASASSQSRKERQNAAEETTDSEDLAEKRKTSWEQDSPIGRAPFGLQQGDLSPGPPSTANITDIPVSPMFPEFVSLEFCQPWNSSEFTGKSRRR